MAWRVYNGVNANLVAIDGLTIDDSKYSVFSHLHGGYIALIIFQLSTEIKYASHLKDDQYI
jgi:hypothetical protein